MVSKLRKPLAWLGVAAFLIAAADAQAAGLVGYRNDTNQPVIVQSAVVVNNSIRRSKPQLLYPGEMAVDGLSATGLRRVTLYDPKKPNTPLHQEDIRVVGDVFLSIRLDTTVMVKGKSMSAKFKLAPVRIPELTGRRK